MLYKNIRDSNAFDLKYDMIIIAFALGQVSPLYQKKDYITYLR